MRSRPALSPSLAGTLAVAFGACLWGAWGVVLRRAGLPGATSACIALATLSIVAAPALPRRRIADARLWGILAAIGVCDAANTMLFFQALDRGPLAVAVLTHYLAPLIVALVSPLVLRAWPSPTTVVALPIALVGLALLLGDGLSTGSATLPTAALGAGSAVFFAANLLLSKHAGDRLSPTELLVYHAIVSALLLTPFALASGAPPLRGVLTVMGGAVLSGAGGGLLFLWGLARIPASRAGVLTYLEPVVGIALGAVVLHERLAPLAPLGALLVIGAGVMAARR